MKYEPPYYEAPVDGVPMALCAKCRCIKPTKKFVHTRTRLEADRKNLPRKYESNICQDCKAPPKSPTRMTMKELRNRVNSGDLRPHVVKEIVEKRITKARGAMRSAVERRWDKECREAWQPVFSGIRKELHRNAQAAKYLAHPPDNAPEVIPGAAERRAFYETYKRVLQAMRAALEFDHVDARREKPQSPWWPDFLPPDKRRELHDAWLAIPLDARQRLRMPDFLRPKLASEAGVVTTQVAKIIA